MKDLLLVGKRYPPGGKISVEELSRELGVSRTPIWGAINRLEAEGVVEIIPRQGVYLLNFDQQRARDIYVAREALEGMAARLAAKRATGRHLALLKTLLEKQASCLASTDVEGYSKATIAFHQHICQAAGSKTLQRLLASVYAQIQAMRVTIKYFPTNLPASFEDHAKILQALEIRDPHLAEREARAHIRMLSEQIARTVEGGPDTETGGLYAG